MIYVVATTKVKPEGREAFVAAAKACIAETLKEKGCISYALHADVSDPDTFVLRGTLGDAGRSHGTQPRAAPKGVA